MELVSEKSAFAKLTEAELAAVRKLGKPQTFADGAPIFRAGQGEIGLMVVESGVAEIRTADIKADVLARHEKGEFLGDIDVLTGRPVVVDAFASGETTLLMVPSSEVRGVLAGVPKLGEKLLLAFAVRREMHKGQVVGHRLLGAKNDIDAICLQEFLFKNFVPYTFVDADSDGGKALMVELSLTCDDLPAVECLPGEGRTLLKKPSVRDVAKCVGVVRPCPEKLYDLAIIGAGPAGMTAAVYAASEGLSVIVLDRTGPGGQASGTSMIENFIGFPSGLSGNELAGRGYIQMLKFGAQLVVPVGVCSIESHEHEHRLLTDDVPVRARVVLVATGAKWKKLSAKNAERYERNGIYYSATAVESRMCIGKEVAVVGAGNSGGQAAMFLSECAPKVYLIVHSDSMEKGMSAYLHDRVKANPKIEVIFNGEVTAVHGEETPAGDPVLMGISVSDLTKNANRELKVSALFAFIGAEPHTDMVPPEAARDENGYLLTGHLAHDSDKWLDKTRSPCELETTIPGILAAGDVRAGSTKRVGFAVGDGSMAVTCVHRLLQR